tara:strand:- start:994 stop:1704 length:711 start_codon:yes stop_codon:yes gene_type:complete
MLKFFYLFILLFFLVYLLYSYILTIEKVTNNKNPSLKKDGYLILKNMKKENVLNILPHGYHFLDYKYSIKGCSLSTFHRDVTSSQYIFKTKYPVYTYIKYFNTGPHLSICPGSHLTVPNLFNNPEIIYGEKGDSYLFNCDLVHAGAMNRFGKSRFVVQYKIAHQSDFPKLKDLHGLYKDKIGNCNINSLTEIFLRKCSLMFSYIGNHVLTPYLQRNDNTFFNKLLLKLYGRSFYNK